jgi:hypothetical protein
VLLDDMLEVSGSSSLPAARGTISRFLLAAAVIAALALLIVAQVWSSTHGVVGPLHSLLDDYLANPQSAAVSWAGLALACVGVTAGIRFVGLAAAVTLDLLVLGLQALCGWHVAVGTGPTLVLTALTVTVCRWRGERRRTALHAIALGVLLIMASKVADTWLMVTIVAGPRVLDQYVQLSDRALGEPSWLMGRLLEALGRVPADLLHVVYIQLPVAAVVVAGWQLRDVTTGPWPRHNLVRTCLTLGLIGPLGYVLFPVVGPAFAYGSLGHGLQIGDWPHHLPALAHAARPMRFDSVTARNCMPSMHAAWALALFIHSRTGSRWLRWAGSFWLVGTVLATLGFGYHYGCDLAAGAVLCMTVESALRDPDRGWDRPRLRMVALGLVAFTGLLLSYRFLPVTMARYPVPAGVAVLGTLFVVSFVFYATWFAPANSRPARWCAAGTPLRPGANRPDPADLSSVSAPSAIRTTRANS